VPFTNVMPQFKSGTLHSGSKNGPKVTDRSQAVAIMLSEKRKGESGEKPEYASGFHGVRHS
jgi:hypothetical protein